MDIVTRATMVTVVVGLCLIGPANALATLGPGQAPIVAPEERVLGSCTARVEVQTLLVIGDEAANVIEVVGTEDGILVTCDDVTATFAGVEELTVQAGDGDDRITTDHRNGLLADIVVRVYGQAAQDFYTRFAVDVLAGTSERPNAYDGGPGEDLLLFITGPRADRLDLSPGPEAGSVEARLTDLATGTLVTSIAGSALESATFKGGDGDDVFHANATGLAGIEFNLLGQGGDDVGVITSVENLPHGSADEPFPSIFSGGTGKDRFGYASSTPQPEHYQIVPGPDREVPSPRIRVTDLVTGLATANMLVQETEEIRIVAGGGDDRLDVEWDVALMSGLNTIEADLGDGDDTLTADLLPVRTLPARREAQLVRFAVLAGAGDDRISVRHAAGSWLDLDVAAQLGGGDDRFSALLIPPPEGDLPPPEGDAPPPEGDTPPPEGDVPPPDGDEPAPEGTRLAHVEVVAGDENDVVAVRNDTAGAIFEVVVAAYLGRGDDLFEGVGDMAPSIQPGPGIDTARVTRNLLPFVSAFELVEVLEDGP